MVPLGKSSDSIHLAEKIMSVSKPHILLWNPFAAYREPACCYAGGVSTDTASISLSEQHQEGSTDQMEICPIGPGKGLGLVTRKRMFELPTLKGIWIIFSLVKRGEY